MRRRVVVTSMGVVSSLGATSEEIGKRLSVGAPRFVFTGEEGLWAAPVEGFDLKAYTGRFKAGRYLNRGAQFAVASAAAAIEASGLSEKQRADTGLFCGSGPNFDVGEEFARIDHGEISEEGLSALWMLRFLPNTAASAISRLTGIHGENHTCGSACAASLTALGEAYRKIRDGYLDTALAGGGDSRINRGGLLAYGMARALHRSEMDPSTEYAPFDASRKGFLPGEGGAFFLFEELEHARRRGAEIHAEVLGFGSSLDGYNMTAPDPSGTWAEKAVRLALDEAFLLPEEVDAVSAHGTATDLNDRMEADLFKRVFTSRQPAILAPKAWLGHLASACGAVELAVMLSALKHGVLPSNPNLTDPLDPSLDVVTGPRSADGVSTLLFENFGFGGQNSALVVRRWQP
ncbi:beta-ketoacyl-[acyl-carrier-protein] synthase family protein [Desulfoluna butyratoxydans]|uniref:Thiolase-like n=1 Tax=Desulfoluna butyratoxydans TaxID=231438 RepID=A0A4V6IKX1_9BACT|nr:beta-ketoacyl-[acyl-carrier-protein] synthase family protein [Desulfoluna butyratoxydans]VFQ42888.1 thiolase-like [Desulfoluna butyratoxydans]